MQERLRLGILAWLRRKDNCDLKRITKSKRIESIPKGRQKVEFLDDVRENEDKLENCFGIYRIMEEDYIASQDLYRVAELSKNDD